MTPPNASDFTPKFVPGARLPHAWIRARAGSAVLDLVPPVDVSYVKEFGPEEIAARQFSMLDLVDIDSFILIVSSAIAWQTKVEQIWALLHRSNVQLKVWSVDGDFEIVDVKQRDLFEAGAGLLNGGGLVVRPDQHIIARVKETMTAQDIAALIINHLGM